MSKAVLDALTAKFGDAITKTEATFGDATATVQRDRLVEVARWLRDDPAMAMNLPSFCTVIDWLGHPGFPPGHPSEAGPDRARYQAVYQLRSLPKNHRVRLKIDLDDDDPRCPSLAGLWPAFDWLEREAFDMYGVKFDGHPDLRRIYMYEEFVGHPLRKDYPKDKRQPLVRRTFEE
jgi:NADH-quinone oxidoreductase subunit C